MVKIQDVIQTQLTEVQGQLREVREDIERCDDSGSGDKNILCRERDALIKKETDLLKQKEMFK